MTFDEKMEIQNKIKKRNTIGFLIFAAMLIAAYFHFIPFGFSLIVIFTTMAIIMVINSFIDGQANETRVLVLAGFLIFFVYNFYVTKMNLEITAHKLTKQCYKHVSSSHEFFCEDIKHTLLPPSDDWWDD